MLGGAGRGLPRVAVLSLTSDLERARGHTFTPAASEPFVVAPSGIHDPFGGDTRSALDVKLSDLHSPLCNSPLEAPYLVEVHSHFTEVHKTFRTPRGWREMHGQ